MAFMASVMGAEASCLLLKIDTESDSSSMKEVQMLNTYILTKYQKHPHSCSFLLSESNHPKPTFPNFFSVLQMRFRGI